MADRITPEQRSRNMRQVHGKDTGPEVYLRKLLFADGFRYRIHSSKVQGHPDIWLKKYNTAVFVHGCFWHRHQGCKYASTPETRKEFWEDKFRKNISRDQKVKEDLLSKGIKVLIVWECTIKNMKKNQSEQKEVIQRIISFFASEDMYTEL